MIWVTMSAASKENCTLEIGPEAFFAIDSRIRPHESLSLDSAQLARQLVLAARP